MLCKLHYTLPSQREFGPPVQVLKQLSRVKTIILKNADKGTTSVMMSKESKINEGLALLNEKNNYQNSGSLSYLLDTSLVSVLLVE